MVIKHEDYVDKSISNENLKAYFIDNGNGSGEFAQCKEYIAYLYGLSERPDVNCQLKVSDKRKEIWVKNDIDVRLYIWVDQEMKVKGLSPYKYEELYAGHGRPQIVEVDLNQDEIKIIKRFINIII